VTQHMGEISFLGGKRRKERGRKERREKGGL
jgi:hypothetical protein